MTKPVFIEIQGITNEELEHLKKISSLTPQSHRKGIWISLHKDGKPLGCYILESVFNAQLEKLRC